MKQTQEIDRCGSLEMPRYRCYKTVHALKLAAVQLAADGATAVLTPCEDRYAPFEVPGEYIDKHNPQPGGYYVVYADGYKSFSPAEAFEAGYVLEE